jgi:phenylpyruvate tautomerase PptA (4-oxalocrotonate tautomerase family)
MDAAHKTEVHAWVNSAILEVTGYASEPDAGASVLVVINEAPEGKWGAGGKTIGLGSIAQCIYAHWMRNQRITRKISKSPFYSLVGLTPLSLEIMAVSPRVMFRRPHTTAEGSNES